ncbi:MAG: proliferating cell nuclear antigen (pcna) [Thermoprotei archaeon]|nr:MAG: proliferating cell nuclear antigen (pcna) [Thermoprotei archaeon]RLE89859.1 MAG: proliferating cell nuclear antigen (pcna) [Thermoprotei archaeon]
MSVKFVFGDAREWRYIVQSLAALIDEACFTLSEEGLSLRALDPSRIAMVDLELPNTVFEEFECPEETKIGVDVEELNKILRRGKADERVEFEVSGGRLRVRILGKAIRSFSIPLIDVVGEELPRLRAEFNVKARLLSDTLKDAVKDAEMVSDSVKFEGLEDYLRLYSSSDRGEVETIFDRDSGALIEYDVIEPSTATYSISYLSDMLKKASSLSDVAMVEFSTDRPLALTFEIAGGGKLAYYLAPRMEV